MPSSSGSSDEIMMMPAPRCGQPVHQVVDLDLGADVDAARGLVEDEDARVAGQPLAEHHLLLIAAAQQPHLLRRRGLDAEILDDRFGEVALRSGAGRNPARGQLAGRGAARCCAPPSARRPGPRPCDPPAAGRCPWRIASAGCAKRGTALPSQRMRPASARSAPASTRASSLRPAPSRPAMPTTSPARRLKLMSCSTPRRPRCSTREQLRPGRCARRLRKVIAEIAIGHQPHQLGDRDLRQQLRRHVPAVAQHRHAWPMR